MEKRLGVKGWLGQVLVRPEISAYRADMKAPPCSDSFLTYQCDFSTHAILKLDPHYLGLTFRQLCR
jgi:hypothetical protein